MKKILILAICFLSMQLVSAQSMKETMVDNVVIELPSDWTSQAGDFVGYLYLSPKQESRYRDHAVVLLDDVAKEISYKELEKNMMDIIQNYIDQSSIISYKTKTVDFNNDVLSTTMNIVAEAGNAVVRTTSKVVDDQIVTVMYFVNASHENKWESQINSTFASF